MLSYGNHELQTSIIEQFRDAVAANQTGQYFLFGLRRIFELGKYRPLMKPPAQSAELVTSADGEGAAGRGELETVHALIQNAALFVQNICENHNFEVKRFLHLQDQAMATVDLVTGIAAVTMKMSEQLSNNIAYLDDENAPAFLLALGRGYVSDKQK